MALYKCCIIIIIIIIFGDNLSRFLPIGRPAHSQTSSFKTLKGPQKH